MPLRPKANATLLPWKPDSPEAGSTVNLMIFSGDLAATSSISIPPSLEATKAILEVDLSIKTAK